MMMRRPIWLLMTILLFGALLGAACGGGDSGGGDANDDGNATAAIEDADADLEVALEMGDFFFGPAAITVRAGDVVEIVLSNAGVLLHDFTIDKIDSDVHITELHGVVDHDHDETGSTMDVHIALDPGGEGLVKLVAHEPGTYTFYCTVPGHREGGMEGTLTVN